MDDWVTTKEGKRLTVCLPVRQWYDTVLDACLRMSLWDREWESNQPMVCATTCRDHTIYGVIGFNDLFWNWVRSTTESWKKEKKFTPEKSPCTILYQKFAQEIELRWSQKPDTNLGAGDQSGSAELRGLTKNIGLDKRPLDLITFKFIKSY